MKKIIHLSDLHIGHDDCYEQFGKIADRIIETLKPPEDYVIVITGDIVDNANHIEQTDAALKQINLLEKSGFRVLLVPGNHDYGTGINGNPEFVRIFKKRYYGSYRVSYPKLDIIDGMAFIGLDSTAEELHFLDRFLSEGELGKRQLKRLKLILERPGLKELKKVVYLHHHPFDFKLGMQLKDSRLLEKIIENRIDLLLFGHYHVDPESVDRNYHGTWGIPRCYNAGSSTHKNGNKGYQRIIDLAGKDTLADIDAMFIPT